MIMYGSVIMLMVDESKERECSVKSLSGLFFQLLCGQEESVQCLLEQEASVLVGDCRGRSSLHIAAARGHASCLSELLTVASADSSIPPLRDRHGYTPLHWACYNGQS